MLAGKQGLDQPEASAANLNRPLPKLHSLNVGGEIKSLKVGKDDKGPYAEITFTEQAIAEFESRPFIATEPSVDLEKIAKDLSTRLNDSVLDLMGKGFSFVSSLRPTSIKAIDKHTLRVGIDPAQLDVLSYYEKIHAEQVKAHGGELRGTLALFADYSAKKEETFVLFAQNGVTFKKGKIGPDASWAEIPYYVIFHNVDKVVGVDKKGGQKEYADGEIAKIIGTGKHPFKPNGLFLVSPSYSGKPQYVPLAFDKAMVDPKTHDITFEVGFLQAASCRKGIRYVPPQFMKDEPVKVEGPLAVYLDGLYVTRIGKI